MDFTTAGRDGSGVKTGLLLAAIFLTGTALLSLVAGGCSGDRTRN